MASGPFVLFGGLRWRTSSPLPRERVRHGEVSDSRDRSRSQRMGGRVARQIKNDPRFSHIMIRLNDEELALIKRAARQRHLAPSTWMRQVALDAAQVLLSAKGPDELPG